jgi:hypothetical protein
VNVSRRGIVGLFDRFLGRRRRRLKRHGLFEDGQGGLKFEFTPDEQRAIERQMALFKGYVVREDSVDDFRTVLAAQGLVTLAWDSELAASRARDASERDGLLERAFVEYGKAFSVFPARTILGAMALVMKKLGQHSHAADAAREFRTLPSPLTGWREEFVTLFEDWHLMLMWGISIEDFQEQVSATCDED